LEGIEPQNLMTNFVGVIIAIVVILIGIVIMVSRIRSVKKWNRVIALAKAQNEFTMKEMSIKSGVPEDKIVPILVEAIVAEELDGSIEGDKFTKGTRRPSVAPIPSETAKVLVICPYCGAKTEQGITKCQKCGADI
jgi:ribosomal protein L40E